MLDRRAFFKGIVALAAAPLVSKIPIAHKIGAWATIKMRAGQIEAVTITNLGSGYTSPPTITVSDS